LLIMATQHQTVGGGLPCLPTAFAAAHYCTASVHFSRFTDQLVPAGEEPIDSSTAHPVGNWVNGAATIESSIS